MATPAGTDAYRDRFADAFDDRYFRRFGDCSVSSVGIGTHLGEPTDETDMRYREAIVAALAGGANVVDTAVSYRCGRAERVVGEAVREAEAAREEVMVATKGGYLPFDGDEPADPAAYVHSEFVDAGIVEPDELAGGRHAISPDAIDWMLDRSLSTLGLETVDLYYVHDPEEQLAARSRAELYDRLEATFRRLEERVAAGDIRGYGVSSREAFRVPRDHDRYLSIAEIAERSLAASEAAGTDEPGLRAVQLPFNALAGDAFTVWAQDSPDGEWNALGAAEKLDLSVFACSPLAGGRVIGTMPEDVAAWFDGDTTAQRAINFARSAPGVVCALVGMRSVDHVDENVRTGRFGDMGPEAFSVVFEADR